MCERAPHICVDLDCSHMLSLRFLTVPERWTRERPIASSVAISEALRAEPAPPYDDKERMLLSWSLEPGAWSLEPGAMVRLDSAQAPERPESEER